MKDIIKKLNEEKVASDQKQGSCITKTNLKNKHADEKFNWKGMSLTLSSRISFPCVVSQTLIVQSCEL